MSNKQKKFCVTLKKTVNDDVSIDARNTTEAKEKVINALHSMGMTEWEAVDAWEINDIQ